MSLSAEANYEERRAAAVDAMQGASFDHDSPSMCVDDALKAFGARELVAELRAARAENEKLRSALNYIKQPTMAFPGSKGGPWEDITPPTLPDPEWWVRNGYGEPDDLRLALATCIGMARAALAAAAVGLEEETEATK